MTKEELETEIAILHNTCGAYEREIARWRRQDAVLVVSTLQALLEKFEERRNKGELIMPKIVVVDATTKAPIQNASVSITNQTDATGTVDYSKITSIILSVSAPGYGTYLNQPYGNINLETVIGIGLTAVANPVTPTTLAPFTISMSGEDARPLINQYITAGGVANIDNGQYWVDNWNDWGRPDPAYFTTKLETGISKQPNYNGYFGQIQ